MSADNKNKYANDNEVKWLVAQRINGAEWEIKYLGFGDIPNLEDEDGYIHPIIDNSPAYIRDISEFAVFKNRQDWWTKKPYRLLDLRDKSNWTIKANFSFINELDAGYF